MVLHGRVSVHVAGGWCMSCPAGEGKCGWNMRGIIAHCPVSISGMRRKRKVKKRRKPSKILTASGIASSAEKTVNFDILPYVYIKSVGFRNRNLGILQAYLPENEPQMGQKAGKMGVWNGKNIGLLWAKHRNFRGKSTALSCKEVRCFGFSGRKTPVLWPKKTVKVLMPRFCDISERVRTWWLPMAFSGH